VKKLLSGARGSTGNFGFGEEPKNGNKSNYHQGKANLGSSEKFSQINHLSNNPSILMANTRQSITPTKLPVNTQTSVVPNIVSNQPAARSVNKADKTLVWAEVKENSINLNDSTDQLGNVK
jgi:hypothetical protein